MPSRTLSLRGAALLLPFIAGMTHAAPAEWKPGAPRSAYVNLFEWSWDSVARECTNFLGPKGFAAVLVSPPNEHRRGSEWWSRYNAVSHQIGSRSGDREQFRRMVQTCKAAGVDVYADTVLKYMGKGVGQGSAGCYHDSTQYNYPCVPFARRDFIDRCAKDGASPAAGGVQCWSGDLSPSTPLPKLDTASAFVQEKLAMYLNDLRSLGVDGFRIDAAHDIPVAELRAILAKVSQPFFVSQELRRDSDFSRAAAAYTQLGSVSEIAFSQTLKYAFLKRDGWNVSRVPATLRDWGLAPSDSAVVYVGDYKTERRGCDRWTPGGVCQSLNAFNPAQRYLANVFLLAYGHGYPQISSGYYFDNGDMGPPAQPYSGGESEPANCSPTFAVGKWDCLHRDFRIANMVGFANYTAGAPFTGWAADGEHRVSFRRGNKGFVAINNGDAAWRSTFATGLPDGEYCDVLASSDPDNCQTKDRVTVRSGKASLVVAPNSAVALHVGQTVQPLPACDAAPFLYFPDRVNAGLNRIVVSDPVTVSGLSCRAKVSVTGGAYSINSGPFTTQDGTVADGDVVRVQVHTSSSELAQPSAPPAASVARLTVGAAHSTFTAYLGDVGNVYPCGAGASCSFPAEPAAGRPVTIYYKGSLATSAQMVLHVGFDDWSYKVHDLAMTKNAGGFWQVTLTVPTCVRELDYVFHNGKSWDNNGANDWRVPVGGGQQGCGAM